MNFITITNLFRNDLNFRLEHCLDRRLQLLPTFKKDSVLPQWIFFSRPSKQAEEAVRTFVKVSSRR